MDLDRQTIEKRDFPFVRRGYDAAAVDDHLATVASEVEALRRSQQQSRRGESLASAAATQVQAIVEAAETTASDIKRQAELEARRVSQDAERDAEQTRDAAVERAQTHVEEVSKATALMLQRVGAMENEVSALIESLRTGANRLTADLALLEGNMGDLYDAAGKRTGKTSRAEEPVGDEEGIVGAHEEEWSADFEGVGKVTPAAPRSRRVESEPPEAHDDEPVEEEVVEVEAEVEEAPEAAAPEPAEASGEARSSEVDARLIALNMALNGQSREEADQYLADNFDIADRAALLDEVFSAVEG